MSALIIDIETTALPVSTLEAMLPEELRSAPQWNGEQEPDWQIDCPAYASAKDREEKRAAWIFAKAAKWQEAQVESRNAAHAAWKAKRDAWFDGAALDPRRGCVTLIGVKIADGKGRTEIFVWEPDEYRGKEVAAHVNSRDAECRWCRTEKTLLTMFFSRFHQLMRGSVIVEEGGFTREDIPDAVTFYGNLFDFPFLYRRAWLLGIPVAMKFRRGRYFSERMIDLHEVWTFGDRSEKTGGLDALARSLGIEGKSGDGARFGELWASDPCGGVDYLLDDIHVTYEVAKRFGIV